VHQLKIDCSLTCCAGFHLTSHQMERIFIHTSLLRNFGTAEKRNASSTKIAVSGGFGWRNGKGLQRSCANSGHGHAATLDARCLAHHLGCGPTHHEQAFIKEGR
jgi:hypothetical protein